MGGTFMFDQITSIERIENKRLRLLTSVAVILFSSLLQTFVIQTFMNPCNLLSSGFTGLAILISKIADLGGIHISVSAGILALNIPAALFCAGKISKRFVFLSCLQFSFTSLFLDVFDFQPLFQDVFLNVCFGGFLYGMATVLALKTDGSTGGTDFIALYIADKWNRSTFELVFAFNVVILLIFGSMFGWLYAGYSIIFQLISTRTINSFYHRYSQILMEITTQYPEEVAEVFKKSFRHGMSVIPAYGAYSQKNYFLCRTIISSYEEAHVLRKVREADPKLLVYTQKVDHFYGSFYRRPIE